MDDFYLWLECNGTRLHGFGRDVQAATLCYLDIGGEVINRRSNNAPGLSKLSREDNFQEEKVLLPEGGVQSVHAELNYVGTYHGKEFYFGTGFRGQGVN